MNLEQALLIAVASLAGCVSFLFMQWRQIALQCERERKECQDKYEMVLFQIGGLEKKLLSRGKPNDI